MIVLKSQLLFVYLQSAPLFGIVRNSFRSLSECKDKHLDLYNYKTWDLFNIF